MFEYILELTDSFFQSGIIVFGISFVIVFALAILLAKLNRKFFKRLVIKQKMDETSARFVRRVIKALIYSFAVFTLIIQINPLRSLSISLLASSGIAVLILGFAAQETFSNLISGFFISIFRPFSVGDYIIVSSINVTGRVEDLNLRHTIVRTFENNRIIVPNSQMNKAVIENRDMIEKKVNNYLLMSISYDSDIDKARAIMIEEVSKHPSLFDNRTQAEIDEQVPLLRVLLTNLNESSVDLRISFWTQDAFSGFFMLTDLRESIKKRFDAEGIEIPYPHRTIVMKQRAQ